MERSLITGELFRSWDELTLERQCEEAEALVIKLTRNFKLLLNQKLEDLFNE